VACHAEWPMLCVNACVTRTSHLAVGPLLAWSWDVPVWHVQLCLCCEDPSIPSPFCPRVRCYALWLMPSRAVHHVRGPPLRVPSTAGRAGPVAHGGSLSSACS
jgi:hypothetical protein